MIRTQHSSILVIFTTIFFATTAFTPNIYAEHSNRNEKRANLENGSWKVIWGKNFTEHDWLKGSKAIADSIGSGNPAPFLAWFGETLNENFSKISRNMPAITRNDFDSWILESLKSKKVVKFRDFEIKAGFATYKRWEEIIYDEPRIKRDKYGFPYVTTERVTKKIPLPNWHQFYIRYRLINENTQNAQKDQTKISGTPGFIQSKNTPGNFEVVTPTTGNGILPLYRSHNESGFPWHAAGTHLAELGHVEEVALIQSRFGDNLELVVRCKDRLSHCYRDENMKWHIGQTFCYEASGSIGFIQNNGKHGNFEVVVPIQGKGFKHYYRSNDEAGFPWHDAGTHLAELGHIEEVALIQSRFSDNLELVVRSGNHLTHCYRDENMKWHIGQTFCYEASGSIGFIQNNGKHGNFEVVVPIQNKGLKHYYRSNDEAGFLWHDAGTHLAELGHIEEVALIQSRFGNNLELVVRCKDRLTHCYRDENMKWHIGKNCLPTKSD